MLTQAKACVEKGEMQQLSNAHRFLCHRISAKGTLLSTVTLAAIPSLIRIYAARKLGGSCYGCVT